MIISWFFFLIISWFFLKLKTSAPWNERRLTMMRQYVFSWSLVDFFFIDMVILILCYLMCDHKLRMYICTAKASAPWNESRSIDGKSGNLWRLQIEYEYVWSFSCLFVDCIWTWRFLVIWNSIIHMHVITLFKYLEWWRTVPCETPTRTIWNSNWTEI